MRFYKLLLMVPMIAFGFAMDANAGSCKPMSCDIHKYDSSELLETTNGYTRENLGGQNNKNIYSYFEGKSCFYCGTKEKGSGDGCNFDDVVVIPGGAHIGAFYCYNDTGADDDWKAKSVKNWCSDSLIKSDSDVPNSFHRNGKYELREVVGGKSQAIITAKRVSNVCRWNGCKQGFVAKDNKCIDPDQEACERTANAKWSGSDCICQETGRYWSKEKKYCMTEEECRTGQFACLGININVSATGGSATIGDITQQQQQKQDSDNQYGNDVVANGSCTTASKGKTESVNCTEAAKIGLDTTGAIECMRECDGQDWLYFKKSCNEEAGYKCEARNVGSGLGCLKCTKGGKSAGGKTGGGSGGGSGSSCRATRTTPEGKACCAYPNSVARYNKDTKGCDCVDTTKEFKMLDGNVGACVAKTDSPAATTPCNCTAAVTVVNTVTSNTCAAASSLVQSSVTNVNMLCPNGQPSASCNSDTLNAYVTTINMAITDCNAQPATPAKPTINEKRLAAAVEAIDKYRSGLDVSVWKDEEGSFNTARLVSDSIAGVVLGTAGGLITSSVVKKNQVKSGFEDIMCTIGGQPVGSYGDEIQVGIQ